MEERVQKREDKFSHLKGEYIFKYFTHTDTNKNCAYINNKCIEQYQTCEIYNSEVHSKNKEECESIILYDNFKSESTYK